MTSSILTNTSAMIALQNLRTTNQSLSDINNQISTGKKVATAKDNAAVFAISQVMKSDVQGFQSISESLSLGASTVAVASNATQQIDDILNEIKGKIVSANEDNVDRATLQNEIGQLRDQITGIVNAAQFNGLNLLQNDGADVDVLSSLDRDSSGTITTREITVSGNNFTQEAGTVGTGQTGFQSTLTGTGLTASSQTIAFNDSTTAITTGAANEVVVTVGPSGAGGAQFTITEADLTTAGGNTDEVLAQVIKDNIDSLGIDGLTTTVGGSGTAELTIDSTSTQAIDIDIAVNGTAAGANAGTTTVAGATGATASGTTATFDVATADGSVTAGDVTLTLGGETFTATNVAAAAGGVAAEIVSQYEASSSQIDGIELSVDGSDNLVVTNLNTDRSFDGLAIDTSALGTAGNDDVNAVSLGNATARGIDITIGAGEIAEGDSFAVTIGDDTATYVAGANDDVNDVVRGLQAVIAADGPSDVSTTLTLSTNTETTGAAITINSDVGKTVSVAEARGGTATGDLYALGQIDVRTADGAAKALNSIESLIQTNIDASAEFGASERRIEIQSDFMGSLIDSFKSGIGSLVDADLEEASARLQALQVQQQLGVQALSIANQAPQNILALFR